MSTTVNRIRNARFSIGNPDPRGWTWTATGRQARSERGTESGKTGITVHSKSTSGVAEWSQVVTCKPGDAYRIEADVTCDLVGDDAEAEIARAGFTLSVCPIVDDRPEGRVRITPGLLQSGGSVSVRTYYEAPDGVRKLRISVGIHAAKGHAAIHNVRFITILDPDADCNPLAIPPPAYTLPVPRVASKVCICSATADERPLTQRLTEFFGESKVSTCQPSAFRAASASADAVLFPDATAPKSITSVTALLKLAEKRIVVISLPAMAALSKRAFAVRRIEQDDDPIHAKVVFANHATVGFALDDAFPYAWPGSNAGSFVQHHVRRGASQKAFFAKHKLTTLLASVCDQEVTCDRSICLYKETPRGGLYVLDIEPVEATASTFGEPALAMQFLLNVLGQSLAGLGQYIVPAQTEGGFRGVISEMPPRFEPFVVHAEDRPIDEVTEQLVTIGREDRTYGLPLAPKPVILVRSGLESGDAESAYGSLIWFKQLVRMSPHTCPYAMALASRFRLAWVPLAAPWDSRDGWRRGADEPTTETTIDCDGAEMAALIDVVSCPTNSVGVVLPSHEGVYRRYIDWLPRTLAAFGPGRYFMPSVADGEPFADRSSYAWRRADHEVQVIVDPDAFASPVHQDALAAGGQVVRIEVPGGDADFAASSIHRTDLVATVLEHVIGLQYGLIVVNRRPVPVSFDGFAPIAPGEALIVERNDPALREEASRAG